MSLSGSVAELTVLALFGPTASGKSGVAEAIAERIPAELVSADAIQVYRGLPILTNQSTHRTHLVGIWPLDHEASVGEYQRLAHQAIDAALQRGLTPVVVGGTGLYLRAALADLGLPPAPPADARERWEHVYDGEGPIRAHAILADRDPEAAAAVHPNDRRRVVRALELTEVGWSLRPASNRLWNAEMRHLTIVFGLDVPKDALERRIEERTRRMFERGVEREVCLAITYPLSDTASHACGLREVAELPREEAMAAIVVRTRRYAAYQRKWMRRIPGLVSVDADRPADEIADEILHLAGIGQRLPAGRAG